MKEVGDALELMTAAELQAVLQRWPVESQQQAMAEIKARSNRSRQVWYCKRGRRCDGKPHEGAPYQHARSDQWPPVGSDWFTWAQVGGRGSGKTRSGTEYVRKMSNYVERIGMIGMTSAAARDTMIEGESGLIRAFERAGETVRYEPSKRRITFPNGGIGTLFSGEEPDRLRGPQHGLIWLDEPAHFAAIQEIWDQASFGLRLGSRPHFMVTTTPLPTKWMKELLASPTTRASKVSTYANLDNLAVNFREAVLKRYEGTRLGRQELHGEILSDVLGALWTSEIIQHLEPDLEPTFFDRLVVGVDPAGTNNRRSDETGIICVGRSGDEGYVLDDESGKFSPSGWARKAINLAERRHATIVVEKNYGGEMVANTIAAEAKHMGIRMPPRVKVVHAMQSKQLRAEPVVALYEQKRIHHVSRPSEDEKGRPSTTLANLEEEQVTWVPGKGDSPNRIDAVVWAFTEAMVDAGQSSIATAAGRAERHPAPDGIPPELARRRSPGLNFRPPGPRSRRMTRR